MSPDAKFSLGLAGVALAIFGIVLVLLLVWAQIYVEMPR